MSRLTHRHECPSRPSCQVEIHGPRPDFAQISRILPEHGCRICDAGECREVLKKWRWPSGPFGRRHNPADGEGDI
jgi:hypothetical protein